MLCIIVPTAAPLPCLVCASSITFYHHSFHLPPRNRVVALQVASSTARGDCSGANLFAELWAVVIGYHSRCNVCVNKLLQRRRHLYGVRVAAIGTAVRRDDLFCRDTAVKNSRTSVLWWRGGGGGSNRGCENTVFYFAERFTVTGAGAATTRIISSFKYRARPRLTFPRRQLNKFKTPVARSTLFDHLDREQGREGLWQYIIYIYIRICISSLLLRARALSPQVNILYTLARIIK